MHATSCERLCAPPVHLLEPPQATWKPHVQAKYMRAMNDIYAKQGINPLAVPGMMLIQVPVFMAFYYAFTNMCDASLPSMVAESAMWGFDWTKVHPMHLFNLTVPATMMLHV